MCTNPHATPNLVKKKAIATGETIRYLRTNSRAEIFNNMASKQLKEAKSFRSQTSRINSEPQRKSLGWTTLKKRKHVNMLCQVHHCLHGHVPQYLRTKLSTDADSG